LKYTMIVTMVDGSVKRFAPPMRPILCQLPIRSRKTGRKLRSKKWESLAPIDIIDAETGEVLVSHGQWLDADIPLQSVEIDVTKPPRIGALAELRDSLTITL
jgi:hypothetical protein